MVESTQSQAVNKALAETAAIGLRIRVVRKAFGWTQEQLATHLGLAGRENVQRWESGQSKPQPSDALPLMAHYGVDFNFIYGGELRSVSVEIATRLASAIATESLASQVLSEDGARVAIALMR